MIKLHKKKKYISRNYRWIQITHIVKFWWPEQAVKLRNTPPRVHLVPVWVCHTLQALNKCLLNEYTNVTSSCLPCFTRRSSSRQEGSFTDTPGALSLKLDIPSGANASPLSQANGHTAPWSSPQGPARVCPPPTLSAEGEAGIIQDEKKSLSSKPTLVKSEIIQEGECSLNG